MKKNYDVLEVEVLGFEALDVIRTSDPSGTTGGPDFEVGGDGSDEVQ